MLKKILAAGLALISGVCFAQSNPGLYYGQVPTPGNWNSYFSAKMDYTIPLSSGNCLTSNGSIWTSVPCTGQLLTVQTITGTSHVYVAADLYSKTRRSNSGTSMTDTLPASSVTGMVNGAQINIANVDSTATDTISAGAGTTIIGGSSFVLQPGRDLSLVYDAPNTTWRGVANTSDSVLFTGTPPTASQLFAGNSIPGFTSPVTIGTGLTLSAGTLSTSGSGGTVTSVAETVPAEFSIAGSPITTSGTLAITKATQSANTFWRGPTTGAAAQPTFGAIVGADLPTPGASSLGGIFSLASSSHNFLTGLATSGSLTSAQPACGDLSNGATGCSTAIGTSGATIPLLNANNNWSGQNIYSIGALFIQGSGGGTTALKSGSSSGTAQVITFPDATDTVTLNAATQTLTNKSIAGSEINSGTVAATYLPTATTGALGVMEVGTGLSVSAGVVTPTFGTAANQVVQGGVITAGGPTGSATVTPVITYNAAGQLTAVSNATITPAIGSITGLGTGIATALGVNVGSAGAPVVNGGALGTPSSGTLTNATGLPLAGLASQAANTVVGNATVGSASPAALSMTSCSTSGSAVTWTTNTGFGCNTSIAANTATSATSATSATTATNIASGTANQIPYQTGAGATGFISAANSSVLVTNGSGVPSESTTLPSGLSVTNLTNTTPTVNGYTEGSCTPTITAGAITITATTIPSGCSTISTLQKLSMVANTAVTLPAPAAGISYTLLVCASGAYSPTFTIASGTLSWAGGSTPTPTATSGKCDLYSFVALGSSYLFGSAVLNFTGS